MNRNSQLPIRVAVWLAAAMLHADGHPTFTPGRLIEEVERRFGDRRPGVVTHVSAHCNASAPKNADRVYNYLVRTPEGDCRLYRPGDPEHPSRAGAPTCPSQTVIPEGYWDLWRAYQTNPRQAG